MFVEEIDSLISQNMMVSPFVSPAAQFRHEMGDFLVSSSVLIGYPCILFAGKYLPVLLEMENSPFRSMIFIDLPSKMTI